MHVYFEGRLTSFCGWAIGGPLLQQERSSKFPILAGIIRLR